MTNWNKNCYSMNLFLMKKRKKKGKLREEKGREEKGREKGKKISAVLCCTIHGFYLLRKKS